MAWNSQPQGLTAAQQQAGTQINPINMQGVVAAILEHQQMQQRQQQIQQQQIQQGLGQYAQLYEQQQHDDLANRSIYQAKYPGDPYSGQPGYDDRVPDYGGTGALRMQEIQQQLAGGSPLQQGLLKQRILAEAALANQRINNPRGGVSANQQAVQQRFEERQALGDVNQQIKDLNTTGGLTATGGTRISRDTLDSSEQVHQSVGPGGEYIPEGYYGIGGKKLETIVPASEFDKAHTALNRYNDMLQRPSGERSSDAGSLPVTEAFAQARAAISAGADRSAVMQRLKDAGYNTNNF